MIKVFRLILVIVTLVLGTSLSAQNQYVENTSIFFRTLRNLNLSPGIGFYWERNGKEDADRGPAPSLAASYRAPESLWVYTFEFESPTMKVVENGYSGSKANVSNFYLKASRKCRLFGQSGFLLGAGLASIEEYNAVKVTTTYIHPVSGLPATNTEYFTSRTRWIGVPFHLGYEKILSDRITVGLETNITMNFLDFKFNSRSLRGYLVLSPWKHL